MARTIDVYPPDSVNAGPTIQEALDQAAVRHDEQLAYYVAQAREVIDLSLGAQQPLLDAMPPLLAALQRIAGPVATADTATAETVDAR